MQRNAKPARENKIKGEKLFEKVRERCNTKDKKVAPFYTGTVISEVIYLQACNLSSDQLKFLLAVVLYFFEHANSESYPYFVVMGMKNQCASYESTLKKEIQLCFFLSFSFFSFFFCFLLQLFGSFVLTGFFFLFFWYVV